MKTKQCTECGEEKSLDEFARNKTRKDGKCIWCKICKSAEQKARWARDPEKYRAKANAKERARRARDPEKYRMKANARARKSYHKTKGAMIAFELMVAANIIQNEFMKGVEDDNTNVKSQKRKLV